ncbi:uncharacterized protein LOC131078580 isoform X3 [Cryptomeria japonica]|nr:uncharacterized protein LOC131078580 isoform X3 [Cryptomeria japonica]
MPSRVYFAPHVFPPWRPNLLGHYSDATRSIMFGCCFSSFLGFEPPHVHVQRFWNPVEFGGIFRVANIPCVNWFTNVTQPGLVHVKNAPKKLIDLGVEFAPME